MIAMIVPLLTSLLCLASCTTSAARAQGAATNAQSSPATRPDAPAIANDQAPVGDPAPDPPLDPAIDALLTRLEHRTNDLTAFSAKIAYEKADALLGRTELRTGEIIYRIEGDNKTFAALFDTRSVNNRLEKRLYHYIFDGRWLAEIDHENKQFIKREIVAPGKKLDPLKLGEGPFPLPVGQSKDEVLKRFIVTGAALPEAGLLKSLKNVEGITLTPRANTPEAEQYQRVDIFYDRETDLPVGINAIESNDDRKTIRLIDMQRNPTLDAKALAKLNIAEPDAKGWDIDIQAWQAR